MAVNVLKLTQYAARVALKARLVNEDVFAAFARNPVPIPPDNYDGDAAVVGEYWIRRL